MAHFVAVQWQAEMIASWNQEAAVGDHMLAVVFVTVALVIHMLTTTSGNQILTSHVPVQHLTTLLAYFYNKNRLNRKLLPSSLRISVFSWSASNLWTEGGALGWSSCHLLQSHDGGEDIWFSEDVVL